MILYLQDKNENFINTFKCKCFIFQANGILLYNLSACLATRGDLELAESFLDASKSGLTHLGIACCAKAEYEESKSENNLSGAEKNKGEQSETRILQQQGHPSILSIRNAASLLLPRLPDLFYSPSSTRPNLHTPDSTSNLGPKDDFSLSCPVGSDSQVTGTEVIATMGFDPALRTPGNADFDFELPLPRPAVSLRLYLISKKAAAISNQAAKMGSVHPRSPLSGVCDETSISSIAWLRQTYGHVLQARRLYPALLRPQEIGLNESISQSTSVLPHKRHLQTQQRQPMSLAVTAQRRLRQQLMMQ
ncbi:unnamed protein product [Protopolystoma xenopodis]|uniref:Uncharacterized protein n=1 Tax=Protopolystoma xenopodis TaxID=117903 RepID=A0A3S5CHH7_9PLAT|nr:unnamed protein product [Protopolystoma xenopodis]